MARRAMAILGLAVMSVSNLIAGGMPGFDKEVALLYIEPGDTIYFTVNFELEESPPKPEHSRGLALWKHREGSLFAFWVNDPNPHTKHDESGGGVVATTSGKNGSFKWTNKTDQTVGILMNAFQHQAENCTRLRLLRSDEANRKFTYGGSEDYTLNRIDVVVRYESPHRK